MTEFATALEQHLRRKQPPAYAAAKPTTAAPTVHEPARIAGRIYEILQSWRQAGLLDGWTLLWLDPHVKSLMDVCGACERIRYTPLSSSYRALLRHGIALYVLDLSDLPDRRHGASSFPLFLLAAYFLIGIEMVAEDIEEPFGTSGDNLALDTCCATIAASTREILPAPGDGSPP